MSRRAKFLVVALGLLLAFRAALPLVIEQVVESVGSRFVDGTVQVDDVDLALLTGGFAIEGLRVDRHTPGSGAPTEPIATLARFAIDLAPSALFAGRAHVQEISLEKGAVHLERSETGDLILPLSQEARDATQSAAAEPKDPNADYLPLPLQLDVLRLTDLHAKLRDPVENVDSATFDLSHLELEGLRVEGRHVSLARIALVEPEALLDRGLIAGPRAMIREPAAEADLEEAQAEVASAQQAATATVPPAEPAPAEVAPTEVARPTEETADSAAPDSASPAIANPAPVGTPDTRIGELSIANGHFTWVDRTHEPVVREESKAFSLIAHDLALSEQGLSNLEIKGQGLRGEPFELTGSPGEDGGTQFHLVLDEFDMTPFGPYATEIAGYDVERGRLSLDSEVIFAFPKITSKNGIIVDELRLGGDGYFESSVGMGANLVIALLSGPDGRIHLDVPVSLELDEEETRLELEQLEGAVQGAMQRSLDGVGAVQGGSPRFEALRSAPGQPSLEAGQEGRIGSLAALLGEKPAVAVVLRGVAADADAAALAAQRGVSPESLPRDQLDALAAQRAEAVRRALAGRGVAANQIEIGGASQGATPGVSWTLALASD